MRSEVIGDWDTLGGLQAEIASALPSGPGLQNIERCPRFSGREALVLPPITNHAAFVCCLGCNDRNWFGCISKKRRNIRRK